ncbi:MAG: hypothetical protein ACR2QF_04850 [Geminicoccaceae bacterium]
MAIKNVTTIKEVRGRKATAKATKKAMPRRTAERPISLTNNDDSIRIRKIENGYIIVTESYTKRGGYNTTERYVADKPKVMVG